MSKRAKALAAVAVGLMALAGLAVLLGPSLADTALGAKPVPPPPFDVPQIDSPDAFPHDLLDAVQREHVTQAGTVDYAALRADPRLGQYVAWLAAYSPHAHPGLFPSRAHELTYWCNAYNALTLWGVVQHWPIGSVREVEVEALFEAGEGQGFFYGLKFELGGQRINLYDLENTTIRGYGDARIHAAINCASLGCPVLDQRAFFPQTLDEHFERLMRGMVAEARNVEVDHDKMEVRANSIFAWFKEDFGDRLDYFIRFADGAKKADLETAKAKGYVLVFVEYDWAINDLGSR